MADLVSAGPGGAGQWLADARAGSREALGQLLEECRGYLLLVAGQELAADLRVKGGASDLVQETFLEAQKDFGRFRGTSEAELVAWLRCLLLHRLSKFARRFRKTQKRGLSREVALGGGDSAADPAAGVASDTPTASGHLMAREQLLALERVLELLPEDYRRVLALRYQEQKSFEEIGRLMDRSAEAVRKLWWRALGRLQVDLETPHDAAP
jgi:RNA polymerase sigma-70 factor (ECF subfamily)